MPASSHYTLLMVYILVLVMSRCASSESLVFPPFGHSYGIRKATPQHLFMFFGPRTFFDNPQGLATARLVSWEDTTKANDDDEVVVYGVNSDRHQIIYNSTMWSLALFGKRGSGENCFLYPKGIAANAQGAVFVADSGNNRVVRLFNPKSKLQWVGIFNGKTEHDAGMKGPTEVVIDEDGLVYVVDSGNHRILVCSKEGKVLRSIGHFSGKPAALAVADGRSRWSFFTNERALFCVDNCGNKVMKLSYTGDILGQVELPPGKCAGFGAIDYYHNYWITDRKNSTVLKYDHNLVLLDTFGSYGTGDNQFVEPRGIAIYKRFGQVFIAEKKGAQYFWIGTNLTNASLGRSKRSDTFTLKLFPTEYSFVSLFAMHGTDTTYFLNRYRVAPGVTICPVYDKRVANKKEKLLIRLEPTYSSFTYSAWYYPIHYK